MIRTIILYFLIFFWPTYAFFGDVGLARTLYGIYIPVFSFLICITSTKINNILIPRFSFIFLLVNLVYVLVFFQTLELADSRRIFLPIKSIFNMLFFISAFNIIYRDVKEFGWEKFWSVGNKFGLLTCLMIVIQFYTSNPSIFSAISAADYVSYVGARPPGTFEWGYLTCFVLIYFFVGNILLTIHEVSVFRLFTVALYSLCILLTQSKSGYLGVIIAVLFILVNVYQYRLVNQKRLILFATIFIITFVSLVSIYIYQYGSDRFIHILKFVDILMGSSSLDGSTSTRLNQIRTAISIGYENWNTGYLGSYDYIIESSYLDYLYRYGIAGILYFISLLVFVFFFTRYSFARLVQVGYLKYANLVTSSVYASVIGLVVISTSGALFDGYKGSLWVGFILAIIVVQNKLSKDNKLGNQL